MRSRFVLAALVACSGVTNSKEDLGGPREDRPAAPGGGLEADAAPILDAPATTGCLAASDCDGDGFGPGEDCDDFDATINPAAFDFPGDGKDNDCNGAVDDAITSCTTGGNEAIDHARAIDLCPQKGRDGKPGYDPIAAAEWGSAAGPGETFEGVRLQLLTGTPVPNVELRRDPRSTKVLPGFGANRARVGDSLIVLASGPLTGRDPRGPGRVPPAQDTHWTTRLDRKLAQVTDGCTVLRLKTAAGSDRGDCIGLVTGSGVKDEKIPVADLAELKLSIKVPTNAQALAFDFAYFSSEFNEFWRTKYNDAFFAIVTSKSIAGRNVAKDTRGLPITVNSGFFQLCPAAPGPSGVQRPESLARCVGSAGAPGASPPVFGTLEGTFYDGVGIGSTNGTVESFGDRKRYVYGGGSGWLTTRFAVEPGETIELRLIMVDSGDGVLDSAVAIDAMRWEKAPPKVPEGSIDRPPT
jgi:hypothetical protein